MILPQLKEMDNKQLFNFTRDCYSCKLWSSETIQKWSKLQEQVKSIDKSLTNRQLAYKWRFL